MRVLKVLFALALCAGIARADSVTLKSGSIMKGRIVSENATSIQLEPAGAAEGSIMELPKDSVASITRVTGSQIIVQQLRPPPAKPAEQTATKSTPIQGPGELSPTDTLAAAERLAAGKRFEQAIRAVSKLYTATNASLADVQRARVLQDDWFGHWADAVNAQLKETVALTSRTEDKIKAQREKLDVLQKQLSDQRATHIVTVNDHTVNGYVYRSRQTTVGPAYVPIGAQGLHMQAENELKKQQQELEKNQQSQEALTKQTNTIAALQGEFTELATTNVDRLKAKAAQELAAMQQIAKQAESMGTTQQTNATQSSQEQVATAPVVAPPQTASHETPSNEIPWLYRNWKWVGGVLGVVVVAKFLGIIKFG